MVTEAEVVRQQVLDVQYRLCVPKEQAVGEVDASPGDESAICGGDVLDGSGVSEFSRFDSVVEVVRDTAAVSPNVKFVPRIRSGSYADIGSRMSMEDEHIRVDDLSLQLGSECCEPSAFYAVFDGHGGPDAASYVKRNVMKLFFQDTVLPRISTIDDAFLKELESYHQKAFLLADLTLASDCSVSNSSGTTALTALILGRHLLVANAGDCRAVLCRRGIAVDISRDHRPSYLPERVRVEGLGGWISDDYLNGRLSVTRALGDWDMKRPYGESSPLISDPDVQHVILSEENEFLIIGCDGIWDVMTSQYAVSLARQALRRHNDPQQCARELVMEALRLNTTDNLTVIVVCFSSVDRLDSPSSPSPSQQRRARCFSLSEEARNRLKSLFEGN